MNNENIEKEKQSSQNFFLLPFVLLDTKQERNQTKRSNVKQLKIVCARIMKEKILFFLCCGKVLKVTRKVVK